MASVLQFTISDPFMVRSFFTVLRRATWCGGKAVVLHPTPSGLEVITSTDGFHFHSRMEAEMLHGYQFLPGDGDAASGADERQREERNSYLAVSARAMRGVTKSDPTEVRLTFDRAADPDALQFHLFFAAPGVRKFFRLRLLPLPPILLQLPPLRQHSHTVEVAASGKLWLDLVPSHKSYCLLAVRPGELEVRWIDPQQHHVATPRPASSSRLPQQDTAAGVGEDVISIPQGVFRYFQLIPQELPQQSASIFRFPPAKAVLPRHLRQACLILEKLGLGMEVLFTGPSMPLVIQSIDPPPHAASYGRGLHPSQTGGGSQTPFPMPGSGEERRRVHVKICIAAKDYPLDESLEEPEAAAGGAGQMIEVRATSSSGAARGPAAPPPSFDISVGQTTMTLVSEIVSSSPSTVIPTQPPPPPSRRRRRSEEARHPPPPHPPSSREDVLVPPSYDSVSASTLGRHSTARESARVNFATFAQSPAAFLQEILGSGDEEDEDENEGVGRCAAATGAERTRGSSQGSPSARATLSAATEEVDEEMESFLRDCADALPPPEMEHPWDFF